MSDYLISDKQRDGSTLKTEDIYKKVLNIIKENGCEGKIPLELVEEYAVCTARWAQCEEQSNKLGLLTKNPISQKPLLSPYVDASMIYLNQSIKLRQEINNLIQKFRRNQDTEVDPIKIIIEKRNYNDNDN